MSCCNNYVSQRGKYYRDDDKIERCMLYDPSKCCDDYLHYIRPDEKVQFCWNFSDYFNQGCKPCNSDIIVSQVWTFEEITTTNELLVIEDLSLDETNACDDTKKDIACAFMNATGLSVGNRYEVKAQITTQKGEIRIACFELEIRECPIDDDCGC